MRCVALRLGLPAVLLAAATLAWAAPTGAGSAPTRYWTELPELEAAVTAAMAARGGGEARVGGDPGLGCFSLELRAEAPNAPVAEVREALEDGLREHGAVVSISEVEGRTRFRLGQLDGVAVTTVDPTAKTARTVACLCTDRYPEEATQLCQRITEASTQ
ncbi:MAG TPA: hypothetical protein VML75_19470 [Kofleriaceae bacterium]|nr:hypothetical protein [Kofleriaceae bacterium]